jgi:hypothetical protein
LRRHVTSEQTSISNELTKKPTSSDITAFLTKAKAIQTVRERQTRLIFTLDATASREPTWAAAKALHRDLFNAGIEGTNLAIQLCYYRGLAEFQHSAWLTTSVELLAYMEQVSCLGGQPNSSDCSSMHFHNEVARPLCVPWFLLAMPSRKARRWLAPSRVNAACSICHCLSFRKVGITTPKAIFKMLAHRSRGAYASFDHSSAERLRELLGAVVRYSSGGIKALTQSGRESDKLLLAQLQSPKS